MSEIQTIQVETTWWLILDGSRPRFVVHYGAAVNRVTGETLMMYRLDAWTLERRDRWTVGHYERLEDAVEVARERLDAPPVVPEHLGYPKY